PDDLVLPGRPGEVAAPAQAPTGTGRADGAALMRPPSPRPGPGAPRSSPQRSLREGAPAPPAGAGTPGYPYRAAPVPAPGACGPRGRAPAPARRPRRGLQSRRVPSASVREHRSGRCGAIGGLPRFLGDSQVALGAGLLEQRAGEAPVAQFVDPALLAHVAEDPAQVLQRGVVEGVAGPIGHRLGDLGELIGGIAGKT